MKTLSRPAVVMLSISLFLAQPINAYCQGQVIQPAAKLGYGPLVGILPSPTADQVITAGVTASGWVMGDLRKRLTLYFWDIHSGGMMRSVPLADSDDPGFPYGVVLSPDGSILYVGSNEEGSIGRLYDTTSGEVLVTLDSGGWLYPAVSGVFNPDGSRIAVLGFTIEWDGSITAAIRIHDVSSGNLLRLLDLPGDGGGGYSLAISQDGRRIAANARTGGIHVYEAESGTLLSNFGPDLNNCDAAAFTSDGSRLLASLFERPDAPFRLLVLFDVETGTIIRDYDAGYQEHVPLSPDDRLFLLRSGEPPSYVSLHSLETGELVQRLLGAGGSDAYNGPTFAADGTQIIATLGHGGDIGLWDYESGELVQTFVGHTDVHSVAFSPDSKTALLYRGKMVPQTWDLDTASFVRSYETVDYRFAAHAYAVFIESGMKVFSVDHYDDGSDSGRRMSVWDRESGECLSSTELPHEDTTFAWDLSSDGKELLAGTDDVCKVWDTQTGELIHAFEAPVRGSSSVAFSANQRKVLTADRSSGLRVWDRETWGFLFSTENEGLEDWHGEFSVDGSRILCAARAASGDGVIRVYDSTSYALLESHNIGAVTIGKPIVAAFSSDGTESAIVREESTIAVVDTKTGANVKTLSCPTPASWPSDLAFSPNGSLLLSAHRNVAYLWVIHERLELKVSRGFHGGVVLSWQTPTDGSTVVLQQRADLRSEDWTNVTVSEPGRLEIVNPTGNLFYRLRKP